jgi:hypothetical protein
MQKSTPKFRNARKNVINKLTAANLRLVLKADDLTEIIKAKNEEAVTMKNILRARNETIRSLKRQLEKRSE